MAEKRMFTQKIIDSDAFLDMPLSTQALYFHLNMRADDDGFINNPKKIQRMIGASEDDLKLLLTKRFILVFESGVIVIKHWRMHNTLRKDRYNPTQYQEEFALLQIKENNSYTEKPTGNQLATTWQPNGNQLATQYSIDKYSIEEYRREGEKDSSPAEPPKEPAPALLGKYRNVKLTKEEYTEIQESFPLDYEKKIDRLSAYMKQKGKSYDSHFATIMEWAKEDAENPKKTDSDRFTRNERSFRGEQDKQSVFDDLCVNSSIGMESKRLPTDEEVEAFKAKIDAEHPDFSLTRRESMVESFRNRTWI